MSKKTKQEKQEKQENPQDDTVLEESKLIKRLDRLSDKLNKNNEYPVVGYMGDYTADVDRRLSTGVAVVDHQLGGGLPLGRSIEIYGLESSGKTTLSEAAIIACQKQGGLAVKIDAENSHHQGRFKAMGGNPGKLLVIQPKTLEDAVSTLLECVEEIDQARQKGELDPEAPILIVYDTLHASGTEKFIETGNLYQGGMAEKARLIQAMFRFCTMWLPHNHACFLIINQVTHAVGSYGAPETTSGGNALRHYPSIRIRTKKLKDPYLADPGDKNSIIGSLTEVAIRKNKVDPPGLPVTVPIRFKTGCDNLQASYLALLEWGCIAKPNRKKQSLLYGGQEVAFWPKTFRDSLSETIPDYEQVLDTMVVRRTWWCPITIDGKPRLQFPSITDGTLALSMQGVWKMDGVEGAASPASSDNPLERQAAEAVTAYVQQALEVIKTFLPAGTTLAAPYELMLGRLDTAKARKASEQLNTLYAASQEAIQAVYTPPATAEEPSDDTPQTDPYTPGRGSGGRRGDRRCGYFSRDGTGNPLGSDDTPRNPSQSL